MGIKHILSLVAFLFLSMGCQTSQLAQYQKLQAGMEKHDVLEVMGSPQSSDRWQGKDRWSYVFYEDNIRFEKEVHFTEGVAIYVGEKVKPVVSATEQDQIYEKQNLQLNLKEQQASKNNQKTIEDYEAETKTETSGFSPQFEPMQ